MSPYCHHHLCQQAGGQEIYHIEQLPYIAVRKSGLVDLKPFQEPFCEESQGSCHAASWVFISLSLQSQRSLMQTRKSSKQSAARQQLVLARIIQLPSTSSKIMYWRLTKGYEWYLLFCARFSIYGSYPQNITQLYL